MGKVINSKSLLPQTFSGTHFRLELDQDRKKESRSGWIFEDKITWQVASVVSPGLLSEYSNHVPGIYTRDIGSVVEPA